jgi:hypothetical protein
VQHDEDGRGEIRRKELDERDQGFDAAGRRPYDDDVMRYRLGGGGDPTSLLRLRGSATFPGYRAGFDFRRSVILRGCRCSS